MMTDFDPAEGEPTTAFGGDYVKPAPTQEEMVQQFAEMLRIVDTNTSAAFAQQRERSREEWVRWGKVVAILLPLTMALLILLVVFS